MTYLQTHKLKKDREFTTGSTVYVKVTHMESPQEFYVQRVIIFIMKLRVYFFMMTNSQVLAFDLERSSSAMTRTSRERIISDRNILFFMWVQYFLLGVSTNLNYFL